MRKRILFAALAMLTVFAVAAWAQDSGVPPQWVQEWSGLVAKWVEGWLATAFPSLSQPFAHWAGTTVSALVTIALVWLLQHLAGFRAAAERVAAGLPASGIGALWLKWRGVVNPLLTLLVGFLAGGGFVGVAAAGVRSLGRSIGRTATKADAVRVAAGAFLALSLLAHPSAAGEIIGDQPDKAPASFAQRVTPSIGIVARKPTARDVEPAVVAQLAWAWTAHIAPRARFVVPLRKERDAEIEAGLFLFF